MDIVHKSPWLKKSIAGLLGLVGISIVVQGIVVASHLNTGDMLIGAMLIIIGSLLSFAAWRLWPSSISDKGKEKIVEEEDDDPVLDDAGDAEGIGEVEEEDDDPVLDDAGDAEGIGEVEEETDVEDDTDAKTMSPNEFHTKMCYVLMAMAIIGGIFSFIGYVLAPDSCGFEENTLFESLGFVLFMISMYAVPINIIIWIVSLFKSDVDSGQVFVLVCLHTLVAILSMFIFGDNYIAQDMFCDSEVFVGGVF